MNKVLVTGASGFIGKTLVKELKAAGYEVVGASRTPHGIADVPHYQLNLSVPLPNDISQFAEYDIIHCAAAVGDSKVSEDEANTVNVEGTRRLLAVNPDRKFIHMSSSSVYDMSKQHGVMKESDFNPDKFPKYYNHYGRTKAEAERLIFNEEVPRNVPPIMLRPHGVYGKEDTTLIPILMQMIESGKLFLPDGGKQVHNLTNVFNVVHAVKCALETPAFVKPEAFNITDNNAVTLLEAVNAAAGKPVKVKSVKPSWILGIPGKMLGISEYKARMLAFSHTYDITKARDMLGYKPMDFKFEWL